MLVMVGHLRDFLFVGADRLVAAGIIEKGFYFITGFGHHAVMIFFVMSGFLVGGSVLDQYINHSFQWRKYFIDRTTRIYVVFLIALAIGGLFDYIGLNFFNQLGIYNHSHEFQFSCDLGNRDVSESLTSKSLIGNVLMLQTLRVPVFGSNGPLWSLAFEWWYYLLFPLLAMVLFSNGLLRKIIGGLGSVCIVALLPINTLLYFGVWLMGVVVRTGIIPSFAGRIPSCLVFVIVMASIRSFGSDSLYLDYLLGVSFAFFINEVHQNPVKMSGISDFFVKLNSFLADFSFSMYVLHFPFILLIINVLNSYFAFSIERQPTIQNILLFSVMMLLTYVYAYIVSIFTENKTSSIRNVLYRRFCYIDENPSAELG